MTPQRMFKRTKTDLAGTAQRFRGAATQTKWERGWPLSTLVVSREKLKVVRLLGTEEFTRNEITRIEVEQIRLPLFWKTAITFHSDRHSSSRFVFTPYSSTKLLAALRTNGWPVTEG